MTTPYAAWGSVTAEDLVQPTTASLLLAFWQELTDGGLDGELVGRLTERAAAVALSQGLCVAEASDKP